jgi:hypothetical protein
MTSHHYPAENGNFNKRLVSLAERIEAGIIDDTNATLLRSAWKISRLASDFRGVYCMAVSRVINAERSTK